MNTQIVKFSGFLWSAYGPLNVLVNLIRDRKRRKMFYGANVQSNGY